MGMRMSKLVISVSAITAATIVWYSWPTKKRDIGPIKRKLPILGLENVGSSCFLNAILQALASLQHFEKWLERKDMGNEMARDEIPPKFHALKYPVIAILYRTVLVVNRVVQKDEYVLTSKLPVILTNVLRRKGQHIVLNEEQDAVEIMQLIFGAINDDMISLETPRRFGSLDSLEFDSDPQSIILDVCKPAVTPEKFPKTIYQTADTNISVSYNIHGYPVIKLADDVSRKSTPPYKGLIASKLECIGCFKKNPISNESFDILSLSLPAVPVQTTTLTKLIDDYLKPTFVHGVDCDECSRISGQTRKSTFVKSLAFGRVPKILCLHIMRTSWSGSEHRLSKRLDHVMFPCKLDMKVFKSIKDLSQSSKGNNSRNPPAPPANGINKQDIIANLMKMKPRDLEHWDAYYDLRAVICHEGDVDNGHYITLRRCPKNITMWYNVSDEVVTAVPVEYVLSCRAYVLFYEYVPSFPPP